MAAALNEMQIRAGQISRKFMRHLGRLNVYQRVQVHTLQVTNDRSGAIFLERHAALTGGSFYDLDAHHWEVMWMDPTAAVVAQ